MTHLDALRCPGSLFYFIMFGESHRLLFIIQSPPSFFFHRPALKYTSILFFLLIRDELNVVSLVLNH